MQPDRKLLFVDNSIDTFYSYRMPLALAAQKTGFTIHLAAPHGEAESSIREAGFVFHPIAMSRSGMGPGELRCLLQLQSLYRQVKPDLVHHLRLKPVLYGGLAAYFARVPAQISMPTGLGHVFTADTIRATVVRTITLLGCRLAFRHPNLRVIFQNPDDLAIFVGSGTLRKDKSVLIRGSGVDISHFVLMPEPAGDPTVVFVARMLRDKGLLEFVQAAGELKRRGTNARFVLVGDTDSGNPTAISAEQVRGWEAAGIVEWWGFRADIRQVLEQANVVCLPSYREGVPKVLIEAAAAGRAIVTTDVPGCREVVRHGYNGLLIPPRDAASLTEALGFLLGSPRVRTRMGRQGRHMAVAHFSLDRVIAETIGTYNEVLEKARTRHRFGDRVAKRTLDVLSALLGLLLVSPLLLVIALAIKWTSPGPIVYRGKRTGQNNRSFYMWKLRTMVVNAEQLGGSATANDDYRITRVGRFLRRYKLDELPQLVNVLKGEMSLVGPRPEVSKYTDRLLGEHRKILLIQPGITDWATIWNANEGEVLDGSPDPEATYEELIQPTKLDLQLRYFYQRSFIVDLQILAATLRKLMQPSYVPGPLRSVPRISSYKDLVKQ